jgi:hypothetical protein
MTQHSTQLTNQDQMEIENNNKLESIFLPWARKQRDEVYKENKPHARFIHYTTADAALKIFKNKCIWMRSTACMADYREVQNGLDILKNFFEDNGKKDSFKNKVESVAPGATKEVLGAINSYIRPGTIHFNTYITSLSLHDDSEDKYGRLSMWRACAALFCGLLDKRAPGT